MTKSQIHALQLLIAADRYYWARHMGNLPVSADDRGVEIWAHGAIAHSTARALVRAGLAEMTDPVVNNSLWLFLGKDSPYDVEVGT